MPWVMAVDTGRLNARKRVEWQVVAIIGKNVDDKTLNQLRENSRIRLDARGVFWHDGAPVTHPGIARLWHRGIGRAADGRLTLTVGDQWCFIEAEDAPYIVRLLSLESNQVLLRLSDETSETLDLSTVTRGAGDVLYCRVKHGVFLARFSQAAQIALAPLVGEDAGHFFLEIGGRRWPIR